MEILVVDDSSLYRQMLASLLSAWNYTPILASNGNDALEMLRLPGAPRLAIVDGVMPGLSGFQLCDAIRRSKSDYVYLILLSANGEQEAVMRGFAEGADDYISKPFNEYEMRARIKVGERIIRAQDELIEAREALRFQATHDPLTGIRNHGAIMEDLDVEISRAGRLGSELSIGLADLDYFKQVNDTYGHLAGDEVLLESAVRLANSLRKYDTVGRYGGEEFLLIFPGCDGEDALGIADRIRDEIAGKPFRRNAQVLTMTMSFGVAEWAPDWNARALVHQADCALYTAKNAGRNRVVLACRPGPTPVRNVHEEEMLGTA